MGRRLAHPLAGGLRTRRGQTDRGRRAPYHMRRTVRRAADGRPSTSLSRTIAFPFDDVREGSEPPRGACSFSVNPSIRRRLGVPRTRPHGDGVLRRPVDGRADLARPASRAAPAARCALGGPRDRRVLPVRDRGDAFRAAPPGPVVPVAVPRGDVRVHLQPADPVPAAGRRGRSSRGNGSTCRACSPR